MLRASDARERRARCCCYARRAMRGDSGSSVTRALRGAETRYVARVEREHMRQRDVTGMREE